MWKEELKHLRDNLDREKEVQQDAHSRKKG